MRKDAGTVRQYAHALLRLERTLTRADAIDEGIATRPAAARVQCMRSVVDFSRRRWAPAGLVMRRPARSAESIFHGRDRAEAACGKCCASIMAAAR